MHDTLAVDWSGILGEMSSSNVQIQAPSKINLSLSVGAPNADGMHPIVSKMVCLHYGDDLEVTRLDDGDLSRYAIFWHDDAKRKSPIDWPITNDLGVRAHRMLEAEVGHSLPVQMKLQKRIPVGGGLGGGSSDAAAMLTAIAELFELDLDLATIGASLGSDVPFLISGGSAIVSGVGEQVEPVNDDQRHLVIVIPDYGCPTGEVYDAFDVIGGGEIDLERVCNGELFNDLFDAACTVAGQLAEDYSTVRMVAEDDVHLSGSGSSMFVICDNAAHADALAQSIEESTTLVAIATHTCVSTNVVEEKR